jgi:tetratricopeptide (TPR) repeat protein
VPPKDSATARAAAALDAELARAQVVLELGAPKDALAKSLAIVEKTRAVGYEPLEARADAILAMASYELGDYAAAEKAFASAFAKAQSARDDELAAGTAARLCWVVGRRLARYGEGALWCQYADSAARRAGNPPKIVMRVALNRAALLRVQGRLEEAWTEAQRAVQPADDFELGITSCPARFVNERVFGALSPRQVQRGTDRRDAHPAVERAAPVELRDPRRRTAITDQQPKRERRLHLFGEAWLGAHLRQIERDLAEKALLKGSERLVVAARASEREVEIARVRSRQRRERVGVGRKARGPPAHELVVRENDTGPRGTRSSDECRERRGERGPVKLVALQHALRDVDERVSRRHAHRSLTKTAENKRSRINWTPHVRRASMRRNHFGGRRRVHHLTRSIRDANTRRSPR